MSTTTTTTASLKRLFADLLEERYTHADESQADVAEWLSDYMDGHYLDAELAEIERTAPDDLRDATMDAIAVIQNYRASNGPDGQGRGAALAAERADVYREIASLQAQKRLRVVARNCQAALGMPIGDQMTAEESRAAIDTWRAANDGASPSELGSGDPVDRLEGDEQADPDLDEQIDSDLDEQIADLEDRQGVLDALLRYRVGQAAVSKWKNAKSTPTPEKWVAVSRYLGLPLAETHRLITFHEMPESVIALQHRLASAAKDNRDLVADLRLLRAELARAERAQRDTNEELVRLRSIATSIEQGDPVGVS